MNKFGPTRSYPLLQFDWVYVQYVVWCYLVEETC